MALLSQIDCAIALMRAYNALLTHGAVGKTHSKAAL
jgi:hypothetical protein